MKIVMVSSVPAFPTTAGNRARIRALAAAIKSLGHELTFVMVPSEADPGDQQAHEAAFGPSSFIRLDNGGSYGQLRYRVRRKAILGVRKALRLSGIEAGYYSTLDQTWSRRWNRQLRQLGADADVVLVAYVFNTAAFEGFPRRARRILDLHDAFGDRHKPYIAQGIHTGYWLSLRLPDESRGFRRADVVLAIQEEEATRFRGQLAAEAADHNPEVRVVSHFLDLGAPIKDHSADRRALFLASNNASNRQAIRRFIDHVLPDIVRELPDFELSLVGTICAEVPDTPNVVRLGRVDDLRPIFQRAPLAINPMFVGTGINIKLLDAMAAGVVTVSTETGVRGLPAHYRAGVRVVPDEQHAEFAREVVRLSLDAELRARLGAAAYRDAEAWNQEQLTALEGSFAVEPQVGRTRSRVSRWAATAFSKS